ncbi:hypothetical protein DV738_g4654, partial [Chaetothyriales sp. CBS 135597]
MAFKVTKLGFRSRVKRIFYRHRPDRSACPSTSVNETPSTTPSPTNDAVSQRIVSPAPADDVLPVSALPTAPIDPGAVNINGNGSATALQADGVGGHERAVGILLDQEDAHQDPDTALYDTTFRAGPPYGADTVVQMLVDQSADVNAPGGVFSPALHAAAVHGHEKVVRKMLDNKPEGKAVAAADVHKALQATQDEGGDEDDFDFLFYRRTKVKKIFSKGRQITRGHGGASAASRKTTSTDPKPVNAVGQSSPSPAVNQSSSSPSLANGVLPVSVVPSVNQSSSSPTPANAASQSSPSPAPANGVLQVSAPPPASPPDPSPVNGPPSAAANSSTAVQQSSPLVSSPHFWSPEALWDDAYKTLKTREPELITEFEQILGGHVTSNEQVQAKVQAQLDGRVAEQWMVHVMDKDVRIRQMAENIFKFLIWSKDLVSTSLTGQPHLALAWSGITMLLPLRIKLQRNSGSVEYRTTVVNLYSCCLEYQAKMACHLSKRTLSRGFHALTESGQWTALKEKIDEADEECTKYQDLIDRKQEDEMWQLQAKRMEEQEMILRQLYKMRLDELNARAADREDDLRDKVIECLVGDYPEHKDANPEAVENTCRWFLDDPRFHNWRDSTTSSLLWLYAGAGCGKSVLSRMLIDKDHLIPAGRAMTSTVCYFFFKNLDNRNSGADALRGILHQLYTQRLHDNLISVAYEATKIYKQKLGSMFNVLWDLLLNTAKQPATGEIICVLDALDECQANARKALLVKIVEFYNACAKATNPQGPQQPCIKFLITSQYRDDIDLRFVHLDPTSNFIRFPGDDRSDLLRQEIDLVIDRLIPEKVPRLNQQSQLLLAEHLKSIDHRTYLWLHLILEEIEQKFPSNSTLARIKTLIAELPNTVNGAYEGILVRSPDPENTRMILQILLAAKRELTVNELITAWHVARSHQTPQSYQDLDLPDQAFHVNLPETFHGNALQAASTYGHEAVVQLLLKSGADVNAQGGPYSNALLAAIDGGFERVVRILLDWGADIHASTGSFDGNALHLASMAGNETIVQMLLDRGADVNASGGVFGHALQAASAHGHEKVVRKLLDNKAEGLWK